MTATSTNSDLAQRAAHVLMGNYGERNLAIVRGEGARCWDADGNEYLDFLAGIAVNNVGHSHPAVVEAIARQAKEMIHCSNAFLIEPQIRLAERLTEATGMERAFFCNSGTEATEAAIKTARIWARNTRGTGHHKVIAFEGSFHGRTLGSMSATWSKKVREGFDPLTPGFEFAKLNDLESVDKVWSDEVGGVLVETIQGEGGIHPCTQEFLEGLRERCTERGAALIVDEVQCGMSRSGRIMAYQHLDIEPDIVPIAKAIGGGLPLGALLVKDEYGQHLAKGTHGSTFGGNPVACAAGLAVCDVLFEDSLLRQVGEMGCYFWGKLEELKSEFPDLIEGVRGKGLMLGLIMKKPSMDMVAIGRRHGMLFNCTADRVIRFLPPLIITRDDIDEAVVKLRSSLTDFSS
ncbi:aspartate aminotransferase family protein [bacterium]|nr:aspartate aminotransferase family protein [bacterium]